VEGALRPPLPTPTQSALRNPAILLGLRKPEIHVRLTKPPSRNIIASIRGSERWVAGFKSERWPASDRNRWPASYWNAWPASSESASQALYSGGGLADPGAPTVSVLNDTFQAQVEGNERLANHQSAFASNLTQWLAAGRPSGAVGTGDGSISADGVQSLNSDDSDAQIQSIITQANTQATTLRQQDAGMTKAFNANTLTIEKATEVSGLDYTEAYTMNVEGGTMSGGGGESFNASALATSTEGTQHTIMQVGLVGLYLSWNENGTE
jgi:hypothetical protein